MADPVTTVGPGSSSSVAPSVGVLSTSKDTSLTDFRSPKRFKPSPPEEEDDDRDVSGLGVTGM